MILVNFKPKFIRSGYNLQEATQSMQQAIDHYLGHLTLTVCELTRET